MGRLFALSKDPTITLGGGNGSADDPTQFGGSLRVLTTTGDRFDSTYNLPPAGWQTIGAPGQNKGYQFTSKTGPINRVTVVPGRRIRVEGAFTATLSTNPDPVELMLRTGATHYCLAFGGKAKFQASKRFTATTSPAPASCPAPVDWSSYGFDLTQTRFNPEEGLINAATVSQLDVQWFFSTGSGMAFVSATPSVVDGVVYVGAWFGRFLDRAREAGVAGVIVPDFPVDEAEAWCEACRSRGIASVFLAAPGSSNERLRRVAAASRGFVYCVATYGVTGERESLAGTAREVAEAIAGCVDPVTGRSPVKKVWRREEVFKGKHLEHAPDLLFEPAEMYSLTHAKSAVEAADWVSGDHRIDGVIVARGPQVAPDAFAEPAALIDIAPTLLAALDAPASVQHTGRVLTQLVGDAATVRAGEAVTIPGMSDEGSAVTDTEAGEMEEHLRGLGYLE